MAETGPETQMGQERAQKGQKSTKTQPRCTYTAQVSSLTWQPCTERPSDRRRPIQPPGIINSHGTRHQPYMESRWDRGVGRSDPPVCRACPDQPGNVQWDWMDSVQGDVIRPERDYPRDRGERGINEVIRLVIGMLRGGTTNRRATACLRK